METFLRFVGEVVAADQAFFTANVDGPVYPVTKAVVEDLTTLFGGSAWLQFVSLDDPLFNKTTELATDDFLENVQRFSPAVVALSADLRPGLTAEMNRADSELHRFINGGDPAGMISRYAAPTSSNFAGHVLSSESVREALVKRFRRKHITLKMSILLGTAIRMLAYDRLARAMHATYIPASGRLNLLSLPPIIVPPMLSLRATNAKAPLAARRTNGTLPDVLDALIVVANGNPREMLRHAWLLRAETSKIRAAFSRLHVRGDAMILRADDLQRECQVVLDNLIGSKAKPRLLDTLFKTVSLTIGFPADSFTIRPSVDEAPMRQWLSYKKRRKQLHGLATILAKAAKLNMKSGYKTLAKNAMIHH